MLHPKAAAHLIHNQIQRGGDDHIVLFRVIPGFDLAHIPVPKVPNQPLRVVKAAEVLGGVLASGLLQVCHSGAPQLIAQQVIQHHRHIACYLWIAAQAEQVKINDALTVINGIVKIKYAHKNPPWYFQYNTKRQRGIAFYFLPPKWRPK